MSSRPSLIPDATYRNSPQAKRPSPKGRESLGVLGSPQQMNDSHLYENDWTERPYLPECWTDYKRMTTLMSPFRAREANPEGWDLKMNFWINCINKWSINTHSVVFSAEDVMKAFERGPKRPDLQCIQLVMSQMKRNKSILSLTQFKAITDSNSNKNWINWGLNTFVVKPFSIGWSLVSSSNNYEIIEEPLPEISGESKFIITQTLQVMSEELNKCINKLEDIDCIRFENLFNKLKNQLNIDLETFEVLISQLEYENKLKVFVDNGIKIVKIGKNVNIKESDIGLIRLEAAKEVLDYEIEKLETEVESIREEAKVCVRNKNKEKAVLLLRKKKRIENKMSQKVTQLDNVELLIDQLLNSSSHNLVLQAFQRANEALKSSNIKQEDIENTMADVEETLDVVNELVSDVSRPLVSGDTEDVEEELDDILKELDGQREQELADNRRKQQTEEELAEVLDNLDVNDISLSEREETPKKDIQLNAV